MPSRKRSMRKVPLFIETRLSSLGQYFRVAVVQSIQKADIQAGLYTHIGLTWGDGSVMTAEPRVLDTRFGRYAQRNVDGQVIARRDLPKIEKIIRYINPRPFGRGTPCNVTQVRLVLQREHVAGPQYALETTVLLVGDDSCIVRFDVLADFSALDVDIDRKLLFALNLLQEAVGGINVFFPGASVQDYLDTVQVNWEILPAGDRENNLRLILSSFRPRTQEAWEELQRRASERYNLFESLFPRSIIRGTGGLSGYMGALIDDQTVVFENLAPGNATYVLFADWTTQSQRTKTDLLANGVEGEDYIRVVHAGDWQLRIRNLVAERVQ